MQKSKAESFLSLMGPSSGTYLHCFLIHQPKLRDNGYTASALRVMSFYFQAFADTFFCCCWL